MAAKLLAAIRDPWSRGDEVWLAAMRVVFLLALLAALTPAR